MTWAATATLLLVILGALPALAEEPADSNQTQAKYDPPDGAAAPAPAKQSQSKQNQPPAKQSQPSGKQPPPAASKSQPQAKPATSQSRRDPAAPRPSGRVRCLSQGETRETVSARKLFSPFTALRTAGAHARGETIGVRLCRHSDDLFYEVNVLRRDGRVVKVILDAASGKIVRSVNDR